MKLALATAAVASTLTALTWPALHGAVGGPGGSLIRQARVDGHGVRFWAQRARENAAATRWQRKRAGKLTRRLAITVAPLQHAYEHAAELAAIAYGVSADTLIRKGRCETGGWVGFTNASSGAAGPWQFIRSTWLSTPYAAYSAYDPLAAALAAGWMHSASVGRSGEWSCR